VLLHLTNTHVCEISGGTIARLPPFWLQACHFTHTSLHPYRQTLYLMHTRVGSITMVIVIQCNQLHIFEKL